MRTAYIASLALYRGHELELVWTARTTLGMFQQIYTRSCMNPVRRSLMLAGLITKSRC
jgi:hypothetical protein